MDRLWIQLIAIDKTLEELEARIVKLETEVLLSEIEESLRGQDTQIKTGPTCDPA